MSNDAIVIFLTELISLKKEIIKNIKLEKIENEEKIIELIENLFFVSFGI